MKSGVRNLIILALFISSSAYAYNSDAWPSTNKYRIDNPANYFQATNLWSLKETATWTQTSTTNFIPEVTPFAGYSSIPAYTNGTRSLTNVQRMIIQADVSTNTTITWTNQVGYTNETAFGDESVETILIVTQQEERIDWGLDVPHIWAWDTYTMLAKRYQVLNIGTNAWNPREAAMSFKPKFYYSQRDNLEGFKGWAESAGFVDKSKADNNGIFNAYFSTAIGWEWKVEYVWSTNTLNGSTSVYVSATNDYWSPTLLPSVVPIHDKKSITLAINGPYQDGPVETIEYTADVPGWFANNTNEYEVTNYTFTATITGAMERTWFDYTPYRDLGGWGQGLSNPVSGKHVLEVWAASTATVRSLIYDTCNNPFVTESTGFTNASGVVTSTVFRLMQFCRVETNAYSASSNNITIPAPFSLPVNPPTTIFASRAAYTNIVTNLVADVSPTNVFTNVLQSASYAAPAIVTNAFTCTLTNIAVGSHEREYGYKHMPAVLSQLVWTVDYGWTTVVNTSSPPDWSTSVGTWEVAGSTNDPIDPTGWTHLSTNTETPILAWKYTLDTTNAPVGPNPSFTNEYDCGDCIDASLDPVTSVVEWVTLPAGHFAFTDSGIADGTGGSCDAAISDALDEIEWFNAWDLGTSNCTTNDILIPVRSVQVYCDGGGVFTALATEYKHRIVPDCDPDGIDPGDRYAYIYKRQSQQIIWPELATNYPSVRDEYYRAFNPVKTGDQPDNESFFTGTLSNRFSRYATTAASTAPNVLRTDFDSTAKPFAGDAITNMGWQINGGFLIQKWEFGD